MDLFTGLGYNVGPRLRELAPCGKKEAVFTQPRTHVLAHLCTLTFEIDLHLSHPTFIHFLFFSFALGTQGKEPRAMAGHEGRHLGVHGLAGQHLFPATELDERRFLLIFRRRRGMQ